MPTNPNSLFNGLALIKSFLFPGKEIPLPPAIFISLTIFLFILFNKTSFTTFNVFLLVTRSPLINLFSIFFFFKVSDICGPPP